MKVPFLEAEDASLWRCEYDIFPFQNSLGRKYFLNVLIQEHFYHKLRPIFDMTICQPPWNQQLMDFYIQVRIGG